MEWEPGSIVRCIKAKFGSETVGKHYVVIETPQGYSEPLGGFWVAADDYGYRNAYPYQNFVLVKAAEEIADEPLPSVPGKELFGV